MSALRAACEHGHYDKHRVSVGWDVEPCPGGRTVTDDELIELFRAALFVDRKASLDKRYGDTG